MEKDVTHLIAETIQEGLKDSYETFQQVWKEKDTDFEAIILSLTKLFAVDTIITKGMLEAANLPPGDIKELKKWVMKGVLIQHLNTGFLTRKDIERTYPDVLSGSEIDQAAAIAEGAISEGDVKDLMAAVEASLGEKGELN